MIQEPVSLRFTNRAVSYAEYRPGYPAAVIERIISGFNQLELLQAADMGAGTGISSRMLADRGLNITAIEPDPEMINAATPYPGVIFLNRRAESTGLKNESMDIVTSFQSFHWFEFKSSLKEFYRILKPTGRLCLVWSYWDCTDRFTHDFSSILSPSNGQYSKIASPYSRFPSGYIKHNRIRMLWKFHHLPYFRKAKHFNFNYDQILSLDGLIGCARSQSFVPVHGLAWNKIVNSITSMMNGKDYACLRYKINLFISSPAIGMIPALKKD